MSESGRPAGALAWRRISRPPTILALLTALNFLNYLDRYIVAAVSPKFQEALGLSDFQTGLAISAFMVGYFVTSPVFGWLGDRRGASSPGAPAASAEHETARIWLIAIGVASWSAATALSGLARTGTELMAARVAVGVGEASYATLAPTIIDDLAPVGSKNRWLAIFYLATPVGSALGYLLGGLLEHRFGWRSAFFIAGGPGIVLAAVVLLIREPVRARPAEKNPVFARVAAMLLRARVYLACVAGYCAYTFALGGFAAWAPKFLYTVHRMPLAEADFGFGLVAVLSGIVGTTLGGLLADRWMPKGATDDVRMRAYLRFSAMATLVAVPASVATLLATTPMAFFAAIFVCETALFASTSPINAVLLGSVPVAVRATAMAASIFAIHALGDFISPPLIGRIADISTLSTGLAILPVAIAGCVGLWSLGARLPLRGGAPRAPRG